MIRKVLFVDDDTNLLAALQRNLRKQFSFDCAPGGCEALDLVRRSGPYGVVVCDMRMPGMDGVATLERIRALSPDTVRIMMTGNADQQTAVDAVNKGQIFRFLNKPCAHDLLSQTLETALTHYELIRVEKELLEGTLMGSVKALVDVIALVAPHAHARADSIRQAMKELGGPAGAPATWELEVSALLSPIGCASLPHSVLRKLSVRSALTLDEQAMVDRVPRVGHDLIKGIPRLENVAAAILYQHKHFDGTGFPGDFCSGGQIPLAGRLLRILTDRLELEAEGIVRNHARDVLKARRGVHDPDLLELSFKVLPGAIHRTPVGERAPIAISVAELAAGQRLARDLNTSNGLVLVGTGHVLTAIMVERIRNLAELGDVSEPILVVDEPRPAVAS